MKKIAFILQALTGGGAERTVANLSFALSEYCEVYIILFDGTKIGYPHKGTIIDLGVPSKESSFDKIINVIRRTRKLRQIKREYNFDVVVSFMFGANFVNVLSRYNEKVVTSARNYMSAYGLTLSRKFQEIYTGRKADRIVAISEMVKQDLIKSFGLPSDKIETIYNPCDVDRIKTYYTAPPSFEFDEECFYFVTAGRLVRQKGQWDLLKSFSILAKKCESARLIILGTGELEGELKELARKLGIEDKTFFLGFQSNPYAYMKKCNAFVLTSLHEGLGNVILEAMACDLPVISTDCFAGPREVLAPELDLFEKAETINYCSYGILVPEISHEVDFTTTISTKHELLADAMERVMTTNDLTDRYITKNPERLQSFNPTIIAEQWYNMLSMVVGQDE
jgi:glycosyltransferase involved in cell wall biosynthesis